MLALLGLLVVVPLLPALTLRAPVFHGDGILETVPLLTALARDVQRGGIPLWDAHTFAGAKPFYAMNLGGAYYPPMYPFYFLTDTESPARVVRMLLILPFALHLLWAAAGGYAFARVALRLHRAGAFVLAAIYSLSPTMAINLITTDIAYLFSYLPWVMLALARFMETGRRAWWVAGAVFLGLMNSVGGITYLIRVYFIAAATFALLWLFRMQSAEDAAARAWRPGRFLAAIGMLALGAGLSGFGWAASLEGTAWMRGTFEMTAEWAAAAQPDSSMPPLCALAMFLPNFFGLPDVHGWGIVLENSVTSLSTVSGGMFVMTAVLAGLCWLPRRPGDEQERRLRVWAWIAALILVGALFTMMGRFTPVFRWLCAVLPWFFRFPHPVYYQFAACWSVAVLGGIGVSSLAAVPAFRDRVGRPALVRACLAVPVAGGAIALLRPALVDGASMPAYRTLGVFHEWRWFLTGPVLHFAVAGAALLAGFRLLPARRRPGLLAAGIAIETLWLFCLLVYVLPSDVQLRRAPDYKAFTPSQRCASLGDFPPADVTATFRQLARDGQARWTAVPSVWDNLAWPSDSRALLGFPSKPLLPRFADVLERFAAGMPYGLHYTRAPFPLFNNMSVRYVLSGGDRPPDARRLVAATPAVSLYEITEPLPHVFTQDRVVALGSEAQLQRFCETDLRRAVHVDPDLPAEIPRAADPGAGELSPEEREHFDGLQQRNRILRVDRGRANRMLIEAEMATPAMLVITECWHPGWRAEVDGRPVPLWQVNYLQQGLWVEPGRHTIRLGFFPRSVRWGALVSALSAVIAAVAALCPAWRRPDRSGQSRG